MGELLAATVTALARNQALLAAAIEGFREAGRRRAALAEPARVLIVEARYYEGLSDALLEGATAALKEGGAEYDVVTVPVLVAVTE